MCRASPRDRDNDGNKYESLLSNPPVEQNLVHGSFCTGDDCYVTKTKADEEDAASNHSPPTSPAVPSTTSTTLTAIDGCKRLVEKIISSFETPPLVEELRSLGKFTSVNDGATKKSGDTSSSPGINKLVGSEAGKENSLPIIDISCMRTPVTSGGGENNNEIVRLPVIKRIFRFYVHNKPQVENVPNVVVKDQEEKLVLHPIVHTEEPKFHSAVINEPPKVVLRKIPQPVESNLHVFPLLTPANFNVRNEHFVNNGRNSDTTEGIYHILHPFHSNENLQNLHYFTRPVAERFAPVRLQNYAPERPKLPETVNAPVVPIPLRPTLYRVLVTEPFHVFGDSQVPSGHLHRIYPNEDTVPVSQWWYPSPSPICSKQIYFVGPNYGQTLPSGFVKKDSPS